MNISDTFYMALCMTILIIGVVYWFWTQTQYIQRKLNLLENIVYEMKTSMNTHPEEQELRPAVYPPAPSSEMGEDEDLLHEELHTQVQAQAQVQVQAQAHTQSPTQDQGQDQEATEDKIESDLQPGGVGATEAKGVHDSMTLKQLRQIAEQKKIPGASAMRKQALIEALRNAETITPFEMTEGSTLDLS